MLSKLFPGLVWLQGYHRGTFKSDLLSGLVIAFMLIPQSMGYALVAGLPPEYGLYACIFPPIVSALLGTSNKISMGPVALDAILIITGLSVLAETGSERYLELAILLTLMVGLLQLGLGLLKFGFIANFLPYPVILGYTSAAALIIIGTQLESMLGVDIGGSNIFALLYQLILQTPNWSWLTLGIGGLGMLIMAVPKRHFPSLPLPLFLLVFGMIASGVWDIQSMGVDVVSSIPQGLPSFSLPNISLSDFEANTESSNISEGFDYALEDDTIFNYKSTGVYNSASEGGLLWNDKDLDIDWGAVNPLVSDKDLIAGIFKNFKSQF